MWGMLTIIQFIMFYLHASCLKSLKYTKIIVLPVVLHVYMKLLSFTLKEEPHWGCVKTGDCKELHDKEVHNLYCPPNIIKEIKLKRMMLVKHVTWIGKSDAYRVLVRKPKRKKPLRRLRLRWIILKWILQKWGVIMWSGFIWPSVGSCKPLGTIKDGGFLD